MRVSIRKPAVAMALLFMVMTACCPQRTVKTGEDQEGSRTRNGAQAAASQTGVTVTKEVPSSKETVEDVKERESKEPLPQRGDVAIPFHRIPRGDNNLPLPGSVMDNNVK